LRIVIDGRYINDAFPGISRYTYNLASALGEVIDDGSRLILLINSKLPNRCHNLAHLAALPPVKLVECPVDRFLPEELLKLGLFVHRLRPNLFHSPFFLRPYPLFSPFIHTIHDLIPLQMPMRFSFAERIIYRVCMHTAARKASAILAISESSANDLLQYWPAASSRSFITPLAPDPVFRRLSVEEKKQEANRLHLQGCRYVFHVSSGLRHKCIELLLPAWKQFLQRCSANSQKLILAGSYGPKHTQFAELAKQLSITNSVSFIGRVDDRDLVALYNCADLFVFPSNVEGFGLPVIEAMACGTPVLTTDAVGMVSGTTEAAWTIPANALDPLVTALEQLLSDEALRQRLSEAGLARAGSCTWRDTARLTWQIYRKTASKTDIL
jgi:glycosyltransferase involved in cell wall biosynthesis